MISDEDIKYFASVHAGGGIEEMATELLQLREEKRQAITPETEQTTDNKTYYCSFCGKTNKDVSTMILGPAVAICNECVRLCLGMLLDKNEGKTIPGEVPK